MKFYDLSENVITILEKMLLNDNLVNLVATDNTTPYSNPIYTDKNSLILSKFFPSPINYDTGVEKHSEIRVFFPQGNIDRKILGSIVVFQIVVHNDLWLIKKDEEKRIRPYDIMHEIVETFENKSYGKLGILHFEDYKFFTINKDFSGYELIANMMTIG